MPLLLVATPIGNLGDLTPRAVQALRDADAVCCEDTRRLAKLLSHAGVPRPRTVLVVNEHTEHDRVPQVLALLAEGRTVVVVSDAGVPGVSDPGERLVRAAVEADHPVSAVPGASAVLTALVVSGLPTARFVMEGFLPRKGSGRTERLQALTAERRTIVLFEAPHRLARTLADLRAHLGDDRPVVVARELTKLHEEVWRGTLAEAAGRAAAHEPMGEHVLVVAGASAPAAATATSVDDAVRAALAQGRSARDAAAAVAAALGVPRRQAYEAALAARSSGAAAGGGVDGGPDGSG